MIRKWLLKHRMINEFGKVVLASLFSLFGYVSWEAGKPASAEIAIPDSYKLMIFGVVTGFMGMLALFIFIDVVYSIIRIIRSSK